MKQKLALGPSNETAGHVELSKENLGPDAPESSILSEARDKIVEIENWQQNLANELQKPIRRKFTRRRVYANGIDEIWAAALVETGRFSKWNDNVCYLLMVIEIFSKFGWIELLKNIKAQSIVKVLNNILKTGRKP